MGQAYKAVEGDISGVTASLGVAFTGFLLSPLRAWERMWVAMVSLLFIAPGLNTLLIGVVAIAPIAFLQFRPSPAAKSG